MNLPYVRRFLGSVCLTLAATTACPLVLAQTTPPTDAAVEAADPPLSELIWNEARRGDPSAFIRTV
ncbi:MAG: hypothetical protein ACK4WH_02680, partial [Phycisphaerales bacterium]